MSDFAIFWKTVRGVFLVTNFTILEVIPDRVIFGASNFAKSFLWVLMIFGACETIVLISTCGEIVHFHILSGNRSIYLKGSYLDGID